MIKIIRNKIFFLLIIVSVLCLIMSYAYFDKKKELDYMQEEYIKQKAITMSLCTYTGAKDILIENSIDTALDYIIDTMNINKEKEVEIVEIKVNSYSVNNDNTISVYVAIEEKPFKTILFHEMTFKKIDGYWKLVKFGVSA